MNILSAPVQKKILAGTSLKSDEIRSFIQRVVEDIHLTTTTKVPIKYFRSIQKRFIDVHSNCFVIKDADGMYYGNNNFQTYFLIIINFQV